MSDYNCYEDLILKTKILSENSQNLLESVAQSYGSRDEWVETKQGKTIFLKISREYGIDIFSRV